MRNFCFFLFILLLPLSAFASQKPVLVTKTFDGKTFDLEEQKGKIVIVNFWASWCSQCRKEILILDRLSKKYPDDLVIIGVSIDYPKDHGRAVELAKKLGYQNCAIQDVLKTIPDNFPFETWKDLGTR